VWKKLKGFGICKRYIFCEFIAESNASNVVLALNNHQQSSHYVGSIIEDCINLNICFYSLNFVHIKRVANQAAHYLAKHVLYNLDHVWIEETPRCIFVVLAFDLLSDFYEIIFNVKK
jgi:hypothetical protein